MKNLFTLFLILSTGFVYAQNDITITEGMVAIEGMSRNSLTVLIKGADTEHVKKAWKKVLKDLKGKVSDKTIIFGDNCRSKEMGDNTFDVYSLVETAIGKGVRLVVAFDLGGAYLSTANHPSQYPAGEKIVYDFAVAQEKEVIQTEIAASQKILSSFEKDLDGLEKNKAEYEMEIIDHKKKIVEAEASIEKNIGDQANKKKEIEGMKAMIIELETKLSAVR